MSSNLAINRICQNCGKEFVARTTVTRYCGDSCAKKGYKKSKRVERYNPINEETLRIKRLQLEELKAREFLSVSQAAKVLGCSRQNVYKLIRSGKLPAKNLLLKKTMIKRVDIDRLFEPEKTPTGVLLEYMLGEIEKLKSQAVPSGITSKHYYSLSEVRNKYGISQSGLDRVLSNNRIEKISQGRQVYVLKSDIDKILKGV